ncbi:heparinase II/III family protein [Blastomonas sp.]|uniref:heparinase II/III domain-containing protein n=1 Tax=Blastomonas sp. TaxID=1909299 RepID=UPI00261F5C1A|nr:heparinase II/III family protein [Blastomonas sp.]MDM7957540.1 heparinase II/III family protein [Blastomonas sp.]
MMRRFALPLLAMMAAMPAAAQTAPQAAQTATADAPLFAAEVTRSKAFVAQMMAEGISVPTPKDPGGGFTHEQHKRNYRAIYEAGQLFAVTGDPVYSGFVRNLLVAYADLYPTLGLHPAQANQQPGKLFWQNLNDAVWLVYAIQGYEQVRDTLSQADRRHIDDDLFRNAARFMSVDAVATFDRIHNHATWSTAGVGMTGYVLGDKDMVDRALRGSKRDGRAGFLRQLDELFSPDGYYAEGPYYQRYALQPFVVFADAIARNDPEQKIFERRDGVLLKAINTGIQLTYGGRFFPFNDAIKDKSLNTEELYQGVAIGYANSRDPALLSIAAYQDRVAFSEAGRAVARDLAAGLAKPFAFRSMLLRDGPKGDQGAVAVLRHGNSEDGLALVAKNSSQGMGHGHFDKLSWQLYNHGDEIVTDYGAARFLNIEAKQGGRYLPENESWAKQSVAHNVLVVDGKSHFDGDAERADRFAPTQLHFAAGEDFSVSTGRIDTAYAGVSMTRTLALVAVPGLQEPVAVDLMRVRADAPHRYDLPLHYNGHIIRQGSALQSHVAQRPVLGDAAGYQHIWVDAEGPVAPEKAFLTWMTDNRFYTWRWVPAAGSTLILGEIGANDPEFNLRREPVLIQRVDGARDLLFAGVLEGHGRHDSSTEQTVASDSQIRSIKSSSGDGVEAVLIETLAGVRVAIAVADDRDPAKPHRITVGGERLDWNGPAARIILPGTTK